MHIWILCCSHSRSQWPLACGDCGIEYRQGHGCLSVVCVVCCKVEVSLQRADHSSRGFLPNVVRLWVWSRNLVNEEVMVRVGPQRPKRNSQKKQYLLIVWFCSGNIIFICEVRNENPTQNKPLSDIERHVGWWWWLSRKLLSRKLRSSKAN